MNGEGARQGAPTTHAEAPTLAASLDGDLRLVVLAYLVEHPDASANEVAREVRRRRQDVRRLVQALRASGVVNYPSDGSQGAGPGSDREARCPSCGAGLRIVEERSS